MRIGCTFTHQAGNFHRINVKIFRHTYLVPRKLSITKAIFYAMKESLMKILDRICVNNIKEIYAETIIMEKTDYA